MSSQSGEKAPLHTGASLDKQGKVWDKSPFRSENRNLPSEEFLGIWQSGVEVSSATTPPAHSVRWVV